MPLPRPNVSVSMRRVGTPTQSAIRRFCVTPRTKRPSRVWLSSSQTSSTTANEKTTMQIRLYGRTRPSITATPPLIHDGFATSTFWAPKMVRTVCIRMRLMPHVHSNVSSGRP